MRPSSPARRQPQAIDAGQFSLPFSGESDASAILESTAPTNNRLAPSADPSERKTSAPQNARAKELRERKRSEKDGKRKLPREASIPPGAKLLVSRREAAGIVSLSIRSIDYLLANKQLPFRKIGARTMIPVSELQRFARMDHPKRLAS